MLFDKINEIIAAFRQNIRSRKACRTFISGQRRPRRVIPAFFCAVGLMALVSSAEAAGSVTYTYDALGRVTSATYSNGMLITYSYDAAGNRTQQTTGYPKLTWSSSSTCPTNCWGTSSWGP